MICGFALLNLKNSQEDSFYHPSVQHYADFFPPQAELELLELVVHGHSPLMYRLGLLKMVMLCHFSNYPPRSSSLPLQCLLLSSLPNMPWSDLV